MREFGEFESFERFVSSQILDYYQGDKADSKAIAKKVYEVCCEYSKVQDLESMQLRFPQEFPAQQYMGADVVVRRFQQMILGLINAKKVLEIGTFVGASTISMARSVGADGHVWSIEKFDKFANIAKENFKANNATNITLLQGDAFEILNNGIDNLGTNDLDSHACGGGGERY